MANVPDHGPPSAAAIAIGSGLIGLAVGYFIAQGNSIGVFSTSSVSTAPTRSTSKPRDASDDDDADDGDSDNDSDADAPDDEAQDLGALKSFRGSSEECKLVLVVRSDLGMGKGKIAAQCSHATLACYKSLVAADPAHPVLRQWERLGQAKVALKVDSEDDMLLLQARAVSLGLCARVIHDAGRTQIAAGSATVLGIGPAPKSSIDEVTGHLKLL